MLYIETTFKSLPNPKDMESEKSIIYYRSEGFPRTGYFIPVHDGVEVGDVGKFFRRRRRRRRPPGGGGAKVQKLIVLLKKTCEQIEKHMYTVGQREILKRGGDQKWSIHEVLKIGFPIVENVRTSCDIVLHTSRGLQLPCPGGKILKAVDFY